MKVQRSEASAEVSEFNLTEVGKEKVKLNDLIKSLKKNTTHVNIKNQLKNAATRKTVQVPLSKPQAEKIKRTVAYSKVSEEIGKWDSIVRSNRVAEQLIFPLNKPQFRLETTEEVAKRFQTKNALEEEVSKLLCKSDNVLQQDKVLTVAEEKALKAMDVAEARARHAELRKMRVLLSHQEAKARRQKKIKSKKYHRILKKEKMKKLMKDFEELQKTDPSEAQEKLDEVDKLRILERMTLKHKSTGKWAKHQKLRAKYNPDSRSALKEQITLSRALTEKVIPDLNSGQDIVDSNVVDDGPDEDVEDRELINMYLADTNIDVNNLKSSKPPVRTLNDERRVLKMVEEKAVVVDDVTNEGDDYADEEEIVEETTNRLKTIEDFESGTMAANRKAKRKVDDLRQSASTKVEEKKINKPVSYVSETDFSTGATILDSLVPDEISSGDEDLDDGDGERMNIMQAFADEDLISEFREEKKAAVEREKPGGIDLFLPGWGSWGGTGIKPLRKKQKRFYINPVNVPKRKDHTLGNVIISEEKDKKAALHQVSELPFPYRSIDQFESTIRQPIGNIWNPENSYHKMIAPKIVTKMGKIIDPMDAEDMVFEKTVDNKSEDVAKPRKKTQKKKHG